MPFGSQSSLSSSSDESVYGSINANNDVEMAPSDPIFTGEARSGKNSNVCGEKVLSPRTRLVILGAVLGVVLLMLGRRTAMPASHQLKHGKGARIKLYNKDDSGIGSLSNGAGNDPFQLSPVENLGMLSIDRADDALPSPIWGNHLKKGLPLPTNSWYLVCLLIDCMEWIWWERITSQLVAAICHSVISATLFPRALLSRFFFRYLYRILCLIERPSDQTIRHASTRSLTSLTQRRRTRAWRDCAFTGRWFKLPMETCKW